MKTYLTYFFLFGIRRPNFLMPLFSGKRPLHPGRVSIEGFEFCSSVYSDPEVSADLRVFVAVFRRRRGRQIQISNSIFTASSFSAPLIKKATCTPQPASAQPPLANIFSLPNGETRNVRGRRSPPQQCRLRPSGDRPRVFKAFCERLESEANFEHAQKFRHPKRSFASQKQRGELKQAIRNSRNRTMNPEPIFSPNP